MVKLAQDIQAAYEVESSNYGNPPDSTLYHLGLLDTFDPRAVEMNITPVPSIGQSTDAHHAAGPIDVTVPLKVALQGSGWQELLGNAIGRTHIDGDETTTGSGAVGADGIDTPHALTTDTYSHAILAKDLSTGQHTLCTGVVVNEATLEADYTAGGYMTLDCACTALYTEDDDGVTADGDFTFNQNDAYNGVVFPSAPTADPLLPTDMTVSYSTASVANALVVTDTAGNYVEIGERYMRFFKEDDTADDGYSASGPIVATGVIDLDHSDYDSGSRMTTLQADIDAVATSCSQNSATTDPQNLLKGIYKMTAGTVNIPAVASTTQTLTEFSNLKTVSLKIANNNTPIPGKTDSIWLQNNAIGRGKADITLDITTTAHDEALYDIYRRTTNSGVIPLVRLDFGTNGSIALTNGTITAFSRPLTGGGEVTDTISIKFRGNGNYRNYSAFAISTDFTLQ